MKPNPYTPAPVSGYFVLGGLWAIGIATFVWAMFQ